MTMLDLSGVKEAGFDLLPAGRYSVQCIEADVKETKSGTGQYIKIQLAVTEGEHEGRRLFKNFNIRNDSEKAQEIGLGELKRFLRCGGANSEKLESSQVLVGLKAVAEVVVRKDSQFGDSNDIKQFHSMEGAGQVNGDLNGDDIPF